MECGYAESRRFLQNFTSGLRAGKADKECDGVERRRRFAPGESEGEGGRGNCGERAFAPGAIDEAGIEGIPDLATKDVEQVRGARVGARERRGGFVGSEEEEVHAIIFRRVGRRELSAKG